MAWVRLDDRFIDHPKFLALSAEAFRLWCEGVTYCNRHLTDGLIPRIALNGFRYVSRARVAELTSQMLWEPHDVGFKVHDYLDYNNCRDYVLAERDGAKQRMAAGRARRRSEVTRAMCSPERSPNVPIGLVDKKDPERECEGKPRSLIADDALAEQAGRFLERYRELYSKFRHGAKLRVTAGPIEFMKALELLQTWDFARLEQLAQVFLTTDEEWITRTDRGFGVFHSRAPWCDNRLSEQEKAGAA